jgi:Ca-activated chloride channel family protein
MRYFLFFLSLSLFHCAHASVFDLNLWKADSKLQKENYQDAVQDYVKIQAKDPSNQRLNYNLGIGLYRLGLYDNAAFNFYETAQKSSSSSLQERAFYNLGNSLFQKEDYKKAITAYEQALAIDANDEDAKYNLELAKKKLEEEQQKQNQQDQNKQEQNQQDQNKQEQNQQDQNKPEQNKQEQNQPDQNKPEQNKQDQNKPDHNQPEQNKQDRQAALKARELEYLLNQVKEGKPAILNLGLNSNKKQDSVENEKPW